jgi:thiol-disulfide isomerase/thioredoxin
MIERLAIFLLLGSVAVIAYYVLRALHVRRMQPAAGAGRPALLYFRSDSCAVCPAQGRVVDQLAAQWDGRLRVERVDAERDPATAARFSVFTLPTTVLVDGDGWVRQVNYGLADVRKLGRQVAALVERPPTADDRPPQEDAEVGLEVSPQRLSAVGRRRSNLLHKELS